LYYFSALIKKDIQCFYWSNKCQIYILIWLTIVTIVTKYA